MPASATDCYGVEQATAALPRAKLCTAPRTGGALMRWSEEHSAGGLETTFCWKVSRKLPRGELPAAVASELARRLDQHAGNSRRSTCLFASLAHFKGKIDLLSRRFAQYQGNWAGAMSGFVGNPGAAWLQNCRAANM